MSFKDRLYSMIRASENIGVTREDKADLEFFFREMTGNIPEIDYALFEEHGALRRHPLTTWICTDTEVGLYYYTLYGKTVAVSYQPARKSDKFLYFIDNDKFVDVLLHINEFIVEEENDNGAYLDEGASEFILTNCPRIEEKDQINWVHSFDIRNHMPYYTEEEK